MRIDDDTDLAEEVESALRALGIATTRARSDVSGNIVDAVAALRRDRDSRRVFETDAGSTGQRK
ncbi:hypothetical protein [Jiella sonneratiae]|uniref:Uncharacterized protein n=1 Tax=Jiella sonneratiae TaxID=2816856 RepID=A0ABS3J6L7_9HYPH|nr:hypothetical protein [Jiella sonneratiae]MBO0905299.1 hypothetical protein [Jiella sonneratiae]